VRHFLQLGLPIYCGAARGHYVALTFDDGPGAETPLALRVLRRAHVRATFFLVGRNLARDPRPPQDELTLGTVGDHTWTHAFLPALSRSAQLEELARTKAALEQAFRVHVELFRPPYGAHDAAIDREAKALGLLEVLWSLDSSDSLPGPQTTWLRIGAAVNRYLRPGAIVLLHENRGQTIRAVKFRIIPELRRRGLVPVTVPELLALDPPSRAQLRAGAGGCLGSTGRPSRTSG
jgi:peptidoglycan/xylan/chitin deacetylase (PgdA/CDA1 family)